MKKLLLALLLLGFIALLSLPAQSVLQSSEEELLLAYQYLDLVIGTPGWDSPESLHRLSEIADVLPAFQRQMLFDSYRYRIGNAISLNVLTGGLGSILQDDSKLPGIGLQLLSTAGFGLTLWGILSSNPDLESQLFTSAQITSGVALAGGVALPIVFGSIRNGKLRRILF